MSDSDTQRCPLCPDYGPPHRAESSSALPPPSPDDTDPERPGSPSTPALNWIECDQCRKWYHAVCVLRQEDDKTKTVPSQLWDEIRQQQREGGEGYWWDWTQLVNKWYCHSCLVRSLPSVNKRPRKPLAASLKANALTKLGPQHSHTHTSPRPATPASPDTLVSSAKRVKLDSESGDRTAVESTSPAPESTTDSRPKRQAALNKPDYHALHNHIATPTSKWLELIHDPGKTNRVINDAKLPCIPGRLLTKAWIESTAPTDSPTPSTPKDYVPMYPLTEASTSAPTAINHPPHLPPTLFYGDKREPLIVRPEDGGFASLGGRLPAKGMTVTEIAQLVGKDKIVDVIDVASQSSVQWPLHKWASYIDSSDAETRTKVYNIISLEISGTELAKQVSPPQIVREIDWVDNFWRLGASGKAGEEGRNEVDASNANGNGNLLAVGHNRGKKEIGWPKVQLYCLMGMKGSWTDWHVDFAASSVYYTIHKGSKVFYLIRPTEANLTQYARWSGSHDFQQNEWLGDKCDEVRKVTLLEGDTMIIPTGYIHAVYTPVDSIVFGGNFLHSYDIPTREKPAGWWELVLTANPELRLRQIEIDTKVPQRFRFPFFDRLCWYVASAYCSQLRELRAYRPSKSQNPIHPRILDGLSKLADFLVYQTSIMEDPTIEDKRRKAIFDKIPNDFKNPTGLIYELSRRVQREMPEVKVEATEPPPLPKAKPETVSRSHAIFGHPKTSRTWAFDPPPWRVVVTPRRTETTTTKSSRPGGSTRQEPAVLHTTAETQTRTREYEVNGEMIRDIQSAKFEEFRTIWPNGS
ncbi:hypothetical protein P7C73_g484, partial [Tremellales sp. Uapishka_1]